MADEPTFTQIIVSKLGTSNEPFGMEGAVLLIVMAVAMAAYLSMEIGAGRLVARLFAGSRRRPGAGEEPPLGK